MAVLTISVSELDLLRVRRTSDSTENDVNLREWEDGTLDTFVGANDGCVTTWFDASGNGNDVTQSTTTLQPKVAVSGTVQEGVVFDGSDDYLTLGARLTSGALSALTLSFFVKTTSGLTRAIMSEWSGTGSLRIWYVEHVAGAIRLYLSPNGINNSSAITTETINDGNWHHVAVVYNGTTVAIYLDNVAATLTFGGGAIPSSLASVAPAFLIGARDGGSVVFPGAIDKVGIWNSALTAGNIATLATGESVGSPLIFLKGNYTP